MKPLIVRLAMGLAVLPLSLISGLAASTSPECTHWASPDMSRSGDTLRSLSQEKTDSKTVENFWAIAKPGDTLCLKDGIYARPSSMIAPPEGLSGLPGAPISVRAEHDGGVLIDGGRRSGSKIKVPVRLRRNDYFVLEGFDVAYSNATVISIAGRWSKQGARDGLKREDWDPIEHVTLRRIVAWDANPRFDEYHACKADSDCSTDRKNGWNANYHVIDIAAARDVLLEDVAAFGTGRKIFQVYLSERVTIRRAWGRWEGNAATHTQTFSCAYRSYQNLCENVIGTWSAQSQDPTIDIDGQLKSVLGMDWFKATDRFQQSPDPYDSGLRVLGSLAYVKSDVTMPPENVVLFGYGKGQVLRDIVGYSGRQTPGTVVLNLTGCLRRVGCSWAKGRGQDAAPLQISAVTVIGGSGRVVMDKEWLNATNFERPTVHPKPNASLPNIFTGTKPGAKLCYRYRDGVKTNEPLWPWPMNQRILAATGYARREATDVEAEVEALFGKIPDVCRTASTESVSAVRSGGGYEP